MENYFEIIAKCLVIIVEIVLAALAAFYYIPNLIANFYHYTIYERIWKILFIFVVILVIIFGFGIWDLCFCNK